MYVYLHHQGLTAMTTKSIEAGAGAVAVSKNPTMAVTSDAGVVTAAVKATKATEAPRAAKSTEGIQAYEATNRVIRLCE
jgi:hypothetical protein